MPLTFLLLFKEQVRRWNDFESEMEKKGIKFGLPDNENKSKRNKECMHNASLLSEMLYLLVEYRMEPLNT